MKPEAVQLLEKWLKNFNVTDMLLVNDVVLGSGYQFKDKLNTYVITKRKLKRNEVLVEVHKKYGDGSFDSFMVDAEYHYLATRMIKLIEEPLVKQVSYAQKHWIISED